jgi:hypothetical protein
MKIARTLGALALVMALALSGCVEMQVGRPIDSGNVSKIVPGRTKKTEIVEWFGQPLRTVAGDNEIAVYRYMDGESACQELIVTYYGETVSNFTSQ